MGSNAGIICTEWLAGSCFNYGVAGMINVSKETARRLLDIHGWSAALLGLALYIVVFAGAIVVFSHEIGAWSVSGHRSGEGLAGTIDQRLAELATEVEKIDKNYLDEVTFFPNAAGEIITFFHTHVKNEKGQLREKGIRFVLDPKSLDIISRAEGLREEMPIISSGFLERFYVDLHVKLHAPDPIGVYMTGILGLILLVAAVSGFILHRQLIKDIFLSPRLSSRLLNTRDRHNLAGTWGIVFSILLAFTGAFFSFATTLGLPVIAITAFGGDQERAMVVLLGEPETEDTTPKQFVGFEGIIQQAQQAELGGSVPVFISVQHWGRVDARVSTVHSPTPENMFFTTHHFEGATGKYLGEKPGLGTVPSAGNTVIGLMGVLHFGVFAGLLSRIIWLSLGLATCYVTLTGLQLWVTRRKNNRLWQSLSRLISIIGYGLPISMIGAAIGFLFSYSRYTQYVEIWTVNGFLIGIVFSFLVGLLFKSSERRKNVFQQLTGLGFISLPIIRSITSGHGWQGYHGSSAVMSMDISLIIAGLILLLLTTNIVQSPNFGRKKLKKSSGYKGLIEEQG